MRIIFIFTLFISPIINADPWTQEIEEWKSNRVMKLTQPHGWLSLIGMEWLNNGANSIGSAQDNSIVLPHGPAYIGSFIYKEKKIRFKLADKVNIMANKKPVEKEIAVKMDSSGDPTIFTIDSFQFYVIERGKPALRIKDSSAQLLSNFSGIDYFPLSDEFKIKAEFVPYDPIKEIEIINVLGLLNMEKSLGKLSFSINNNSYSLDVMDSGEDFYIIFADRTSGRSTYGPGRFLYVPKPQDGQFTTIDFNKAYNPPCAFSDFSTCPLPPPQNRIPVFIKAGEKTYKR